MSTISTISTENTAYVCAWCNYEIDQEGNRLEQIYKAMEVTASHSICIQCYETNF